MDWNAVGAIGETVGAAGVMVSLAYLATQIRQNTKASKAATRQALADGAQRIASDVVEVDDIARILFEALAGKEVQPHETFRIQARCLRDLRFWDNAYYQYTVGLLTREEWEPLRANLYLVMQFPVYRDYWEEFQPMFSAGFREELNSLLESRLNLSLRRMLNLDEEESSAT